MEPESGTVPAGSSKPTGLSDMASEVMHMIAMKVPADDVWSLCLVGNHRLKEQATLVLYEEIRFTARLHNHSCKRAILLLRTLVEEPDLRPHIKAILMGSSGGCYDLYQSMDERNVEAWKTHFQLRQRSHITNLERTVFNLCDLPLCDTDNVSAAPELNLSVCQSTTAALLCLCPALKVLRIPDEHVRFWNGIVNGNMVEFPNVFRLLALNNNPVFRNRDLPPPNIRIFDHIMTAALQCESINSKVLPRLEALEIVNSYDFAHDNGALWAYCHPFASWSEQVSFVARSNAWWIKGEQGHVKFMFKLPALTKLSIAGGRVPWANFADTRTLQLDTIWLQNTTCSPFDAVLACAKSPALKEFKVSSLATSPGLEPPPLASELPFQQNPIEDSPLLLSDALKMRAKTLERLELEAGSLFWVAEAFYGWNVFFEAVEDSFAMTSHAEGHWPCFRRMPPQLSFISSLHNLKHLLIETRILGMFLLYSDFQLTGQLPRSLEVLHLVERAAPVDHRANGANIPLPEFTMPDEGKRERYFVALTRFFWVMEETCISGLPHLKNLIFETEIGGQLGHWPMQPIAQALFKRHGIMLQYLD